MVLKLVNRKKVETEFFFTDSASAQEIFASPSPKKLHVIVPYFICRMINWNCRVEVLLALPFHLKYILNISSGIHYRF